MREPGMTPSDGTAAADFTLLRLCLAVDVALVHFEEITEQVPLGFSALSSLVAVQAFFVVSGWIVTASFEGSASSSAYLVRRLARLIPLYVAVILAQALTVALLSNPAAGVDAAQIVRYVAANLAFANFLEPSLLGYLDGAHVQAINPSLWTLKIEVLFYLTVPIWVALVRRSGWTGLVGLVAVSALFFQAAEPLAEGLSKQLPGQLRFFAAGMMCRLLVQRHGDTLLAHPRWLGCAAIAGLLLALDLEHHPAFTAIEPLFVAVFVLGAALLLPKVRRLPDLSYGIYLIHAPVIQVLHEEDWAGSGLQELLVAGCITAALAWLGHLAIEGPGIRAGKRLSERLTRRAEARRHEASRARSLNEAG